MRYCTIQKMTAPTCKYVNAKVVVLCQWAKVLLHRNNLILKVNVNGGYFHPCYLIVGVKRWGTWVIAIQIEVAGNVSVKIECKTFSVNNNNNLLFWGQKYTLDKIHTKRKINKKK